MMAKKRRGQCPLKKIIFISFLFLAGCTSPLNREKVKSPVADTLAKAKLKPVSDSPASQVLVKTTNQEVCNTNFDTTLLRLAKSFQAKDIHITQSMSGELNQFMLHVDTNCLRQQKSYSLFINTIWAKVVLYQLRCCNQHYEMRHEEDGAEVILEEFTKMAGFQNKQTDFLSSYEVENFIYNTPGLNENPYLHSIMVKIKKEESRIASGNM